jgi:cyclopropane fatty-acyl-phospholipid synthase-like methyltransferase
MTSTFLNSVKPFIELQYLAGSSKDISVLCSFSKIERIFDRIRAQWIHMGSVEPYASVLTEDRFLSKNIGDNLQDFFESGKRGLEIITSLCRKNDVELPNRALFELGCGVGRSTRHFSTAFEKVYAWDVSVGNLSECAKNLERFGVSNANLKLISELRDYNTLPKHDVFFSEMVLQHNPPPLQYFLIQKVLESLNPGGVFLFQTITHHQTYSFDADNYLSWQHDNGFEMHALPMRYIMKLLRENGLFLMDVLKDDLGGFNVDSYTFFGVRP